MAIFQETPQDEHIRKTYIRMQQKDSRRRWWLARIRNLIREGKVEGHRLTEAYWRLFKDADGYQYLKSLIRQ